MHCELAIPGLFAQPAVSGLPPASAPALELILGRARRSQGDARSLEAWLQQAFGAAAEPLPAGALAVLGAGGDPGNSCWVRLDPVHLRLGRDSLTLLPADMFGISDDEARRLCAALGGHFAELLEVLPIKPDRWCARLSKPLDAGLSPPLALCGLSVDEHLKSGAMPSSWHAFLNEAQMLLHEHPVNDAREARAELAINSVWPWGAGHIPAGLASPWNSVAADELIALGMARAAHAQAHELTGDASEWAATTGGEGRHLAVLDALRVPLALGDQPGCAEALRRLEHDWFAPLLGMLRDQRIAMLSIHVPDAAQCTRCLSFEIVRGDLRRIWRRARPLSSYASYASDAPESQ